MARHVLMVLTNPTEGSDDAFNEWYDRVHVPEVLAVPGFVACERFVLAAPVGGALADHRYLAVYEIEADDVAAAVATLQAAAGSMVISPVLDRSSAAVAAYTALGPRVARKEPA